MLKMRGKVVLAVCEEPLTENNWDRYNLIGCGAGNVVYVDITSVVKRDFSYERSCLRVKKIDQVSGVDEYEHFVRVLNIKCSELHIIHLNVYHSELKEVYAVSKRYAETLAFYWPYPPFIPLSLRARFSRQLRIILSIINKQKPIFDYYLCPSLHSAGFFVRKYLHRIDTVAYDVNLCMSSKRLIVEDAIIYIDQMLGFHPDYNRFMSLGEGDKISLQSKYDFLIGEFKKKPEKIIFCSHPRSSAESVSALQRMGMRVMQLHEIDPYNSLLLFHSSTSLHMMAFLSIGKNNRFIGLKPPHPSFSLSCERMSSYYGIMAIDIDDFDINAASACGKMFIVSDKKLAKSRKYLFATDKIIYSSFDPYLERIGFLKG
jgi:hypothetical protein